MSVLAIIQSIEESNLEGFTEVLSVSQRNLNSFCEKISDFLEYMDPECSESKQDYAEEFDGGECIKSVDELIGYVKGVQVYLRMNGFPVPGEHDVNQAFEDLNHLLQKLNEVKQLQEIDVSYDEGTGGLSGYPDQLKNLNASLKEFNQKYVESLSLFDEIQYLRSLSLDERLAAKTHISAIKSEVDAFVSESSSGVEIAEEVVSACHKVRESCDDCVDAVTPFIFDEEYLDGLDDESLSGLLSIMNSYESYGAIKERLDNINNQLTDDIISETTIPNKRELQLEMIQILQVMKFYFNLNGAHKSSENFKFLESCIEGLDKDNLPGPKLMNLKKFISRFCGPSREAVGDKDVLTSGFMALRAIKDPHAVSVEGGNIKATLLQLQSSMVSITEQEKSGGHLKKDMELLQMKKQILQRQIDLCHESRRQLERIVITPSPWNRQGVYFKGNKNLEEVNYLHARTHLLTQGSNVNISRIIKEEIRSGKQPIPNADMNEKEWAMDIASRLQHEAKLKLEEEFSFVKSYIESHPQLRVGTHKIRKKDHGELSHSFVIKNGKPYAVASHEYVGKGAFGKVKVVEDEHGLNFAMKVESMKGPSYKKGNTDRERELLDRMGQHTASFTREDAGKEYTIQTLHLGADIFEGFIETGRIVDENLKFQTAKGCIRAIQELHARGIIHRDIKPQNFMMNVSEGVIVIKAVDFGLARLLPDGESVGTASPGGTFGYIAPEILEEDQYSTASDVYAIGMMLKNNFDINIPEMYAPSPEDRPELDEVIDYLNYLENAGANPLAFSDWEEPPPLVDEQPDEDSEMVKIFDVNGPSHLVGILSSSPSLVFMSQSFKTGQTRLSREDPESELSLAKSQRPR